MTSKIMCIYYDNDCLPYKDKDRTIHYPVVGNAFNGASNTTQIRFYVDRIGGTESVSWVVLGKLPNGKQTYQVLTNIAYDSELNEWYVAFDLSNYYTQLKGDVYFSLAGYNGNIQVEEDEDTGIYTIHGTPTIQTTGAIKLAINYAPQLPLGTQVPMSDLDQLIALISNKVNITNAIVVFHNIATSDLSSYDIGQLFYDNTTKQYYKKTSEGYELVEDGAGILGKKYIDDKYDFILSAFANIVENFENENVLYVKGEVNGTTLTMEVGTISGNTYYLTTSYIFYSKEEIDTILLDYVTNSSLATTLSDYYTKTQVDTSLTTKVDKTSSGNKVYGTDSSGNQATFEYDTFVNGQFVRRVDSNSGNIYVGTPTAMNHATPKQYVDVFAKSLQASINTSTYVMTLTLKDNNGNTLSTQTIDLPLETMVVSGSYDDATESIILVLKNGQTINIPVGDLVSGLVSTSDLASELANYYTNTQTDNLLNNKADKSTTYTKTECDNKFVAKTQTIAGIDMQDNITSQELTDALVFMNNTTDLDYVMGD